MIRTWTGKQIDEIYDYLKQDLNILQIAQKYSVTKNTIVGLINRNNLREKLKLERHEELFKPKSESKTEGGTINDDSQIPRGCRWIYGDPNSKTPWAYCGKPILKRDLCFDHYSISWVKPQNPRHLIINKER